MTTARPFPRLSGTTLIEALVTTAIFTFVSFTVFVIFNMGREHWKLMVLRHGMQLDGRRALSMLEADLRRAHFSSVSVDNRAGRFVTCGGNTYERGGVSMAALNNWRQISNYDAASARPLWNRYVVYYATKETAREGRAGEELGCSGRLFRIALRPCSPTPCSAIGQFPYANFLSNLTDMEAAVSVDAWLQANSGGGAPLVMEWRVLADVNHFSINRDVLNRIVQVTFQTRKRATVSERGTRGATTGGPFETLQLNLNLAPQNSYYLF